MGKPDLCHAFTSLNWFLACPREYHLDLALQIFGYLKQTPSPVICIDSSPLEYEIISAYNLLIPNFLQDYPNACEKLDQNLPQGFRPVLETIIMVDSDHPHNLKICYFLPGLIA